MDYNTLRAAVGTTAAALGINYAKSFYAPSYASKLYSKAKLRYKKRKRGVPKKYKGYLRTGGYFGRSKQELKFIDETLTLVGNIATSGEIHPLIPDIATGTTEITRIGRFITVKKWMMRYNLYYEATTNDQNTTDTVRLLFFIDTQTNGAQPAVLDVLETADFQSFNNLSNSGRFRTLKDVTIVQNATAGAQNGTTPEFGAHSVNRVCALKMNMQMDYSGVTGSITERRTNNMYVLLISSNGRTDMTYSIRTRFTDGH